MIVSFFNAFDHTAYRIPDSITIKYFPLGHNRPFSRLVFSCLTLISCDISSVFILRLSRIRWSIWIYSGPERASSTFVRPSFIFSTHSSTFYRLIQFFQYWYCRYSVKFTRFHTPWPQKSTHRSLFFFTAFRKWCSHVKCVTKGNGKNQSATERSIASFIG